ncbi:CSRN2 protein, partial [Piaya cayana]|nr:CSRN2 protein [Piaya cayana]
MKLELENKRQGGRAAAAEEEAAVAAAVAPGSGGDWLGPPAETQDFQEFMAENETAVMHLQTAEELERLKAEEDSSNASGVESLGVCLLEEPLAVPDGLCPPLAAPLLLQAQLPPGSSVLGFADGSEPAAAAASPSPQPYLNDGPVLYYQVEPPPRAGAKAESSAAQPPDKEPKAGEASKTPSETAPGSEGCRAAPAPCSPCTPERDPEPAAGEEPVLPV